MLLDLRMPRMDGRRLQEEIARDPTLAGAQIPVIVLSADSRRSGEQPLPGAVAVLAKPVRLERLLALIESVVGPPAELSAQRSETTRRRPKACSKRGPMRRGPPADEAGHEEAGLAAG